MYVDEFMTLKQFFHSIFEPNQGNEATTSHSKTFSVNVLIVVCCCKRFDSDNPVMVSLRVIEN